MQRHNGSKALSIVAAMQVVMEVKFQNESDNPRRRKL